MKAKLKKFTFGFDTVEYLGHKITNGIIVADPEKTVTTLNWPVPQTAKQLQQFLGLTNYYNSFVKKFAEIAAPLISLVGKNCVQQW